MDWLLDALPSLALLFGLGFALGRYSVLREFERHRKWHRQQVLEMRERLAACEVVVSESNPIAYQHAQEQMRAAIERIERGDMPTIERRV